MPRIVAGQLGIAASGSATRNGGFLRLTNCSNLSVRLSRPLGQDDWALAADGFFDGCTFSITASLQQALGMATVVKHRPWNWIAPHNRVVLSGHVKLVMAILPPGAFDRFIVTDSRIVSQLGCQRSPAV
ncbi:MAG: hypothetical protein WAW36_17765 [Methylovulum miyakonense]|uniref:hypothetical protein n=1 Tax=Methylovulum miyakonense TaxID=645578 RepID=UPI003BB4A32E